MRKAIARASLALTVLGLPIGPASAATTPPAITDVVPGQVIVRFAPGTSSLTRTRALATIGGRVVRSIPTIGSHLVRTPAEPRAAARQLRALPGVVSAEPNVVGTAQLSEPGDPCYLGSGCALGRQWNIDAVNARAGWGVHPGTYYTQATKAAFTPVKVAVLDSQIKVDRQDFTNAGAGPSNAPWDARNGGQIDIVDAVDILGAGYAGVAGYHGTFVAGIVGASTDNGRDVAGLGYHAQIMPVTVVDGQGRVTAFDLAAGIVHAATKGARVLNLSLGMNEASSDVQVAIDFAIRRGALPIAAAGNNANDLGFYPAQQRGVMAVAATDEADRRGECSNFGPAISVAAPGVKIISLDYDKPSGLGVTPCGTSTATPHVSALAALLFAQLPSRTPDQVREIIEATADDDRFFPGRDEFYGAGRINFERALRAITPGLPIVDGVRTTFPLPLGGTSEATATGIASAPKRIEAAEWFIDALGAPGAGLVAGQAMTPADGVFDSDVEALRTTLTVDRTFPSGVHRFFVRARDADGWGPASVGVLIQDRAAPTITIDKMEQIVSIPALGIPARFTFTLADNYAANATYRVRVTRMIAGVNQQVYQSPVRGPIPVPGDSEAVWTPSIIDVGRFTITLEVWDEAQNLARDTVEALVL